MAMRTRSSRISIMDLPELIIVHILLHLSITNTVVCKCVCKTWQELISSPSFAKLHFAHAKACIVFRPLDFPGIPRKLFLVEQSTINVIESGVELDMKLDNKLKIPLHIFDAQASALCLQNAMMKRTFTLYPKKHKVIIVNSCNGFLCLSDRRHNNPAVVFNPVTNEYIELPAAAIADKKIAVCGLGFSQETNQYKVLRVADKNDKSPSEVEIHTLGTESWRSIGFVPNSKFIKFPTYLNGALYWTSDGSSATDLVVSFDFSRECFKPLPQPPISRHSSKPAISNLSSSNDVVISDPKSMRLCVLEDCLCMCASSGSNLIDIWVMKSCDIQKSWSKLVSINIPTLNRWNTNYFQFISCCEKLLVFVRNEILYFDPKMEELKNLRLHRTGFIDQAIVLTPSFFSLKDVTGSDTKPISTGFRVIGDGMSIYLRMGTTLFGASLVRHEQFAEMT